MNAFPFWFNAFDPFKYWKCMKSLCLSLSALAKLVFVLLDVVY